MRMQSGTAESEVIIVHGETEAEVRARGNNLLFLDIRILSCWVKYSWMARFGVRSYSPRWFAAPRVCCSVPCWQRRWPKPYMSIFISCGPWG